jgi:hypothetical protein
MFAAVWDQAAYWYGVATGLVGVVVYVVLRRL